MFLLFFLLAAYSGYSIITYGNRWFASSHNPRLKRQKENVIAGDILDRNGIVLATTDEQGNRVYQPDQASREAVVHILGDAAGHVANGVESFQTGYLYGFHATFPELLHGFFTGEERKGDTIYLTVDSKLCTHIVQAFNGISTSRGHNGAVVVMNYLTGEVIAEVSLPEFDPQAVESSVLSSTHQPFWNRAVQSVYPPGSTFKIVTAASALQNLTGIDEEFLECTGNLAVGSHSIRDFAGSTHGLLTLKQAFGVSCNNIYASVALRLTDQKLRRTAEQFGFNDNFLFRDLVVENSHYPQSSRRSEWEIGASGFGQSSIAASPIHMCMIAGSVACDGTAMEPILIQRVVSPAGTERMNGEKRVYRHMMDSQTAQTLQDYMRYAVANGTGSRALTGSLPVCGKTGTAESTLNGAPVNYGWFIGYIDSETLPFSVCVLVEGIADGQGGGSTAAPIAREIFSYLMLHPDRVLN